MLNTKTLLEISTLGATGAHFDGIDGSTKSIIAGLAIKLLIEIWDYIAKKRAEKAKKGEKHD